MEGNLVRVRVWGFRVRLRLSLGLVAGFLVRGSKTSLD